MLQFKSIGTPLVLLLAVLSTAGCDQAAESAKQAIDKTNAAAQQALSEAIGSNGEKAPSDAGDKSKTQDI